MRLNRQRIIDLTARTAWWVIALTTVGLNIYALTLMARMIYQVCAGPACYEFQPTPQDIESMRGAGVSLQTYAAAELAQMSISVLAWNGVGLLLYRLRRANPFILWVSLALITFGGSAFGPLSHLVQAGFPLISYAARALGVLGQIGFLFFYVFPDGHFYPRWMRWPALAWVLLMLPGLVLENYDSPAFYPVIFGLFVASAFVIPIWRYRATRDPVQRQQIKWVIFSMAVAIGYFLLSLVIGELTPLLDRPSWFSLIVNLLLYLAMALIPLSVGIAMLRYRLWDIDILIRRTLLYAGLTALLGVLYLATVILLQQLLRDLTGEQSALAVVITTLAIAALFNPLQRRLQVAIDRRFYRKKYDAQQTLERFNLAARSEVDLHELSEHLLAVTDETLQPERMSLWLVSGSLSSTH